MKNKFFIFIFLLKNTCILFFYAVLFLFKIIFFYVRLKFSSYSFKRNIRRYMDEPYASRVSRIYYEKMKDLFKLMKVIDKI